MFTLRIINQHGWTKDIKGYESYADAYDEGWDRLRRDLIADYEVIQN